MIPVGQNPKINIFGRLPDVLRKHTLTYMADESLGKVAQVSKDYLSGVLRLQKVDSSRLNSIYFKALARIDEEHPQWSEYRKNIYCLRAVADLLQRAKYYYEAKHHFPGLKLDLGTLSHAQRIDLAENITHLRRAALIDFFMDLVRQLPDPLNQLEVSPDQSAKDQVQMIRDLLQSDEVKESIAEMGNQLEFEISTIYPVEACSLFPFFNNSQKNIFLFDLIQLEQHELIEKILTEYVTVPTEGGCAGIVMITHCCTCNASPELLGKVIGYVQNAAPQIEEDLDPVNDAEYFQWLQRTVLYCAEMRDFKIMKVLLTLDGFGQLDPLKIIDAIVMGRRDVREKLEFVFHSPLREKITVDHIRYMIDGFTVNQAVSVLKGILELPNASQLNGKEIGAVLDAYIHHYTSPGVLTRKIGFEEFDFVVKKFPQIKDLLKEKIDQRLKQLELFKDPKLMMDLQKLSQMLELEPEPENFLTLPPAARNG